MKGLLQFDLLIINHKVVKVNMLEANEKQQSVRHFVVNDVHCSIWLQSTKVP